MAEDDAADTRVGELEVRSAFQEKSIEDLDAVVLEFTARVERLERELKAVRAQLESIGGMRPDA